MAPVNPIWNQLATYVPMQQQPAAPVLQRQTAAPGPSPQNGVPPGWNTNKNIEDLAAVLWGEMRGKSIPLQVAVGWTVLNRMINRGLASVSAVTSGGQYASLAGAPLRVKLLADSLLRGDWADTTTGSENFFSPRSMPDALNPGCCSGRVGLCNTLRFQSNVDCGGGLQTVPGTQDQRFFPSWASPSKLQAQPGGTDPMDILVYQR
jgi:hypothetical protein